MSTVAGTGAPEDFGVQRRMLDELARLAAQRGRPTIMALAPAIGVSYDIARRCLKWLEHEGFVSLVNRSRVRLDITLITNPGDDELRAAIAGRRDDL